MAALAADGAVDRHPAGVDLALATRPELLTDLVAVQALLERGLEGGQTVLATALRNKTLIGRHAVLVIDNTLSQLLRLRLRRWRLGESERDEEEEEKSDEQRHLTVAAPPIPNRGLVYYSDCLLFCFLTAHCISLLK